VASILLAAVLGGVAPASGSAQEESLALRVNEAVERGVAWLRTQQNEDGSFRGHYSGSYPEGATALALLALHKSAVSARDPAFQKGLAYLRYRPFRHTYSTGVLLVLLDALGEKEYDDWIAKGAEWLLDNRDKNDNIWAYPEGGTDLSNSQYALLGLRAAAHRGVRIPGKVYVDALEYLLRHQHPSGGFSYRPDRPPSGSMTLAGLAIALISLEAGRGEVRSAARLRQYETMVEDAFAWYETRYAIEWNPYGDGGGRTLEFFHYYLFSLERIGIFTKSKSIAGHDWYREGAEFLLAHQEKDGFWKASTSYDSMVDTSFALLFLRRASVTITDPVARARAKEREKTKAGENREGREDAKGDGSADLRDVAIDPDLLFVREWLVLGPFPDKEDVELGRETIRERDAAPVRGARAGGRMWNEHGSGRDFVDLDAVLGPADDCVGYAFVYLYALEDTDALLLVGSDDGIRILVNGETVLESHMLRQARVDEDRVPIRLRRGLNRLLLKVKEYGGAWGFYARLADPEGRPLATVAAGLRRRFDEGDLLQALPVAPPAMGFTSIDLAGATARASGARPDAPPAEGAAMAFDGDLATCWIGAVPSKSAPEEIGIEFREPERIESAECLWRSTREAPALDGFEFEYLLGSTWYPVRAFVLRRLDGAHWIVRFESVRARAVRLTIRSMPDEASRPALREFRLFGDR